MAEIYADVVEALFNYEPRFEVSNVSVVNIADGKIVLDLEGKYIPTGENITSIFETDAKKPTVRSVVSDEQMGASRGSADCTHKTKNKNDESKKGDNDDK